MFVFTFLAPEREFISETEKFSKYIQLFVLFFLFLYLTSFT